MIHTIYVNNGRIEIGYWLAPDVETQTNSWYCVCEVRNFREAGLVVNFLNGGSHETAALTVLADAMEKMHRR